MSLRVGTRLGHCDVTSRLGEGDGHREWGQVRCMVSVLRILVLTAMVLAVKTSVTSAQSLLEDSIGTSGLSSAAIRALRGVEREPRTIPSAPNMQANQPKRSWIKRHPVFFGTIIGAVVGTGIVAAVVDAEAGFVGFYGGAATGAMVGWAVGR